MTLRLKHRLMPRLKQMGKNHHFNHDFMQIKKGVTFAVTPWFSVSGYQDSNLGPPAPKAGALAGLRYAPIKSAEKGGFEPPVAFGATTV